MRRTWLKMSGASFTRVKDEAPPTRVPSRRSSTTAAAVYPILEICEPVLSYGASLSALRGFAYMARHARYFEDRVPGEAGLAAGRPAAVRRWRLLIGAIAIRNNAPSPATGPVPIPTSPQYGACVQLSVSVLLSPVSRSRHPRITRPPSLRSTRAPPHDIQPWASARRQPGTCESSLAR